jgi:two-component system, OmpR family, sensor kinase
MSLRLRLTLLYSGLLGGVLLIFGGLLYGLVSTLMLDQVDTSLAESAQLIIERLKVNSINHFETRSVMDLQLTENLLFQVWGTDRNLQISRPAWLTKPLDETGRLTGVPVYNTIQLGTYRLRVLTVPLVTQRGPVGLLQVGVSLNLVDLLLRSLAVLLVSLTVLFMIISAAMAWLITRQALAPLETATHIATTISKADDLQRRIPLEGSADDEVGQLIATFNQTLERLENLFSSQKRFLADVSHELRTPLTVIKGNVGLLRQFGQVDEETLSGIESEVDRLNRMVGDLLLLAQAESGKLPLLMVTVELDTLLLEVYQQMHLVVGDKLEFRITEIDQAQVLGDRDRLKQLFLNIISNAVDYTPAGGEVLLALCKEDDRQVRITVADNGPGIAPEDLPHIFERFYRGEKSRHRGGGKGFGLGLSIADWIARAHGGTIEVASKPGEGTAFTLRLPLLDQKSG